MTLFRCLAVALLAAVAAGCATTITPSYSSQKPDIVRVGGDRPSDPQPSMENTGSFCVETAERWHQDGKTPDGQSLWAKDTIRRVVACD